MVPARLLDLSRLVSRLGRGPLTGVDRVELAYLTQLLASKPALFGLVRTAAGYLLLDRAGAAGVADLANGGVLGPPDLLSRLIHRRDRLRGRAEATVRRLAIARATPIGLRRLVARVPEGASYLNIGHANLTVDGLSVLHKRFKVAVFVHDTIPLDHPAFSRPDTVAGFARKLAAVAAHADLVIYATDDARRHSERHLRQAGRVPQGIVSPLGVPMPVPQPLPDGLRPPAPYFLVLGTIEPRKNHALLLRVWSALGPDAPRLLVVGGRGWADPALFDALAAAPRVTVLTGLPDGAVASLLLGARALLFPSLAEGFGLPLVEAAALGTPVIASDLPVIREVLGDYPVYIDPVDSYPWMETVKTLALSQTRQTALTPPTWRDHVNTVLNLV